MAFYGKNFIYDGKSSELYGLVCSNTQGGEILSPAGSNISVIEEYSVRRETPYFYGVSFPDKLQFEVEFYSEEEIPRQRVREIEKWLFGLSEYKEFYVIQEDMENIHYNCFFTNAILSCVGNVVYGFHATCICDAPWAWGEEVTHVKEDIDGEFTITNTTDNTRFTKPTIKLYFDSDYDEVSIENLTIIDSDDEDFGLISVAYSSAYDWGSITSAASETEDFGDLTSFSSNAMVFDTITDGELIEINTDLKLITSNKDSIVDRFNGKYMYLIEDENTIDISETISRVEITYTPARKVGS